MPPGGTGFQRGAPELLKTLKRHDAQRGSKKAAASRAAEEPSSPGGASLVEVGAYGGMASEVEQLKRDRLLLLKEVMRLRESQTNTTEEVRAMAERLAVQETMQAQMLAFLQQHLSPGLLSATQHLLPGRKRRHLLLGAPGREEGAGEAPAPLLPPWGDRLAQEAPAAQRAEGSRSAVLRELPDDFPPRGPQSYHALLPPPTLPEVMQLPLGAEDAFNWEHLLADLPSGAAVSEAPAEGLSRLDSEDLHALVRDMELVA